MKTMDITKLRELAGLPLKEAYPATREEFEKALLSGRYRDAIGGTVEEWVDILMVGYEDMVTSSGDHEQALFKMQQEMQNHPDLEGWFSEDDTPMTMDDDDLNQIDVRDFLIRVVADVGMDVENDTQYGKGPNIDPRGWE